MWTSPAATSGKPCAAPSCRRRARRCASSAPRCSSTAIQQRPGNSSRSHAASASARLGRRHPQRETVIQPRLEIGARQPIFALVGREARAGDQRADLCIGSLRRREQHDVQIVERAELRADDQLQLVLLAPRRALARCRPSSIRRSPRVPNSRDRGRSCDQLAWMRCAAQEREVAEAMQLRVAAHDQNPCRYQPPRSPRSW